jgi:hypothetical protein
MGQSDLQDESAGRALLVLLLSRHEAAMGALVLHGTGPRVMNIHCYGTIKPQENQVKC